MVCPIAPLASLRCLFDPARRLQDIGNRIGTGCCDAPEVESAWLTRTGTFFVASLAGFNLVVHVTRLEDELFGEDQAIPIEAVTRFVADEHRDVPVFIPDD